MVMSPVGARCPTCAQVKRFALGLKPIEVLRLVGYGLVVGAVGSVIASLIPFLSLFAFAAVGYAVGEVVSVGANRKRAPVLAPIAVACVVVGYDIGLAGLLVTRGLPLSLALVAPITSLFVGFSALGLVLAALLAWMRAR